MQESEFRDYALSAVREVFSKLQPGEELSAMMMFNTDEGIAFMPVAKLMNPNGGKDMMIHIVRAVARNTPVNALAFVSEVWMAEMEGKGDRDDLPADLGDHPESLEKALVRIEFPNKTPELWNASITRDGETRTLGEFDQIPEKAAISGRMVDPWMPRTDQG